MFRRGKKAITHLKTYRMLKNRWSRYAVVGSILLSMTLTAVSGFQPNSDPPWPTAIAISSIEHRI